MSDYDWVELHRIIPIFILVVGAFLINWKIGIVAVGAAFFFDATIMRAAKAIQATIRLQGVRK